MKVFEVANLLGVSKKTIYRRMDSLFLQNKGHVSRVGKEKDIDLQGVELIRKTMDSGQVTVSVESDNVKVFETAITEQYERLLELQAVTIQRTVDNLMSQLKEKDQVINDKDILIDDLRKDKDRLMQMQENSQVLLRLEQEKTLLLEESPGKKSFWSIFKK